MNEPSFYRVSVKALVRDEQGRILLAKQSNGKWDMLGGGLDHGEEPREGLTREIFEESGLRLLSMAQAPSHFLTVHNPNHDVYLANVIYEAELEHYEIIPSDECEELRFVTVQEAKVLNLNPNVQKLLTLLEPGL